LVAQTSVDSELFLVPKPVCCKVRLALRFVLQGTPCTPVRVLWHWCVGWVERQRNPPFPSTSSSGMQIQIDTIPIYNFSGVQGVPCTYHFDLCITISAGAMERETFKINLGLHSRFQHVRLRFTNHT
jgi:hypothetical protein